MQLRCLVRHLQGLLVHIVVRLLHDKFLRQDLYASVECSSAEHAGTRCGAGRRGTTYLCQGLLEALGGLLKEVQGPGSVCGQEAL